MTIKNRLICAFLAILVLPCAAIGWFAYQKAKSELSAQIDTNTAQSAQFVNNQINDLVAASLADADYLAKNINGGLLDGGENPKLKEVMDPFKAVKGQFANVYYGTAQGLMFLSPAKKLDDGFDPRKQGWYTKAQENKGKAVVNAPAVTADAARAIMLAVTKTNDDGSGVVGGNLDLGKLAEQVKKIKVGDKGYVYILDKDHKYLVHPTAEVGTEKKDDYTAKFYAADSGKVDYTLKGTDKRAVFVTNPLTGWKVIGTIEMSEIADQTNSILYTTLEVIAAALLLGALLVYWIIRSITTPLNTLMAATNKIADGDLSEEINVRSKDELGKLAGSVNHMVTNLRGLIGEVMSSSQNVAAASQEISATTEEIAGGSSAQAQAAQSMQKLFGELSSAIESVASGAEEAADLAAQTTSIAHDGGGIVKKSVSSMNEVSTQMSRLEEDSNKIGDIIEVIDDIAGQTNLLALNAAIEAARAGEQGKGFAVVADEVRKLAERSGEATKQITAIIKGMQQNTHRSVSAVSDGVSQTQETGKAFEQIIEMISQTEHKVGEIASASQQQAAQSNEVMRSIEKISSASEEAAAASEETAATSQSLAKLAENLNDSVSSFKLK